MINAYAMTPVTILRTGARDSWGAPEADPELILVRALVKEHNKLVTTINGEEIFSPFVLYFSRRIEAALGRTLTLEDKVALEGDLEPRAILRISRPKGFSRPHYEVNLA